MEHWLEVCPSSAPCPAPVHPVAEAQQRPPEQRCLWLPGRDPKPWHRSLLEALKSTVLSNNCPHKIKIYPLETSALTILAAHQELKNAPAKLPCCQMLLPGWGKDIAEYVNVVTSWTATVYQTVQKNNYLWCFHHLCLGPTWANHRDIWHGDRGLGVKTLGPVKPPETYSSHQSFAILWSFTNCLHHPRCQVHIVWIWPLQSGKKRQADLFRLEVSRFRPANILIPCQRSGTGWSVGPKLPEGLFSSFKLNSAKLQNCDPCQSRDQNPEWASIRW